MVFKGEDALSKVVVLNCNCGCDETLKVMKVKNEDICDEEYYISLLASKFQEKQISIIRLILHRLKLAVKMLLGKEYLLTEIVLSRREFSEFIEDLKDLTKID